jgi:uncharacterized membrane protein
MLLDIGIFFGRLHPLVVHLPIGFLLLALFFYLLSLRNRFKSLAAAVPIALLFGSVSAMVACVSGYTLSRYGSYDEITLNGHLRLGIVTTAFSFLGYLVTNRKLQVSWFQNQRASLIALCAIFILVNFTGHSGGMLTHGSNYLQASILFSKANSKSIVTNVDSAYIFADLVKPIFDAKCSSCHNAEKKSGKLSLESISSILEGGKEGPGIKPGDPEKSEIIKRISLPSRSKKFMPVNGQTPLTWQETELIRWWSSVVSSADKKMMDVKPPPEIRKHAAAYLGITIQGDADSYPLSQIQAPPLNNEVVEPLRHSGFTIKYLHHEPAILDVTLPPMNKTRFDTLLSSLLAVKDNILWLNLSGNRVSDHDLDIVSRFTNLQRLRLDRTSITDQGMRSLVKLSYLQSLNVSQTGVTIEGIRALRNMNSLKRVYVWNSRVATNGAVSNDYPFELVNGYGSPLSNAAKVHTDEGDK